jgi:hypothetical protein
MIKNVMDGFEEIKEMARWYWLDFQSISST